MSHFTKLTITLIGSTIALYFFTCTSFSFNKKETISEDKLISFVSTELEYELLYGDNTIDMERFIDNAIKERLQNN